MICFEQDLGQKKAISFEVQDECVVVQTWDVAVDTNNNVSIKETNTMLVDTKQLFHLMKTIQSSAYRG